MAKEAGTTRAAVYRRWPSKAELATAASAAMSEAHLHSMRLVRINIRGSVGGATHPGVVDEDVEAPRIGLDPSGPRKHWPGQ